MKDHLTTIDTRFPVRRTADENNIAFLTKQLSAFTTEVGGKE